MTVSFSAPCNAVKATNKQAVFALMKDICFDVWSRSEVAVFPSDNVHLQQAAQISKALVDEQVDFEAMVNIGAGKRL